MAPKIKLNVSLLQNEKKRKVLKVKGFRKTAWRSPAPRGAMWGSGVVTEPLAHFREVDVKKFIRNNIISRFGIFRALVSDNGTQFVGQKVKKILDELKIEFYNSTLSYLHCNTQTKASNKTTINGIKKRLKKAKGKWIEELPSVLCTNEIRPQKEMNKKLYFLAFDFKVVFERTKRLSTCRVVFFNSWHF